MTEFRCDTCGVTVLGGGAVWVDFEWIRQTLASLGRGEEPQRTRWQVGCDEHSPDRDVYDMTVRLAKMPHMVEHLAGKPWARFTVWPDPSVEFKPVEWPEQARVDPFTGQEAS